ncbi:MAG: cytochrome-c peroxidase, partial [Verrucomicrobiota bacterium]
MSAATVKIKVQPMFQRDPLQMSALRYTNAAGEHISITRLSYFLSNFAFENSDGSWIHLTNSVAWMDAALDRPDFQPQFLPPASIRTLRFQVGLDPAANHANPATRAADDPLNPNLNGLHWSWQGGFVFVALEGHWLARDGSQNGYSFHLTTDRMLTTIALPVALDLNNHDHAQEIRIAFHVDRLFSGRHKITLAETSSTHSGEQDEVADRLRENICHAFEIERVCPLAPAPEPARTATTVEMAPTATPYRFAIPGFFPQPALPRDNPLTEEGVALGRQLFHDPQLSINHTQSCASCHQAEAAFIDAGRRFSIGAEGKVGSRNSMPLFNLAWKSSFFWDGRAATLRE